MHACVVVQQLLKGKFQLSAQENTVYINGMTCFCQLSALRSWDVVAVAILV